jgi:hypothetical protein
MTYTLNNYRAILINWLKEVQIEFNLSVAVLNLCINYVDNFLKSVNPPICVLQLLGATSLYIASKKLYSNNNYDINMFIDVCDGVYTKHQFLLMEKILNVLIN